MKRALRMIMILGLAWSATGCATMTTWEHLVIRADEPLREFKPSAQLYEGRFFGTVEKNISLKSGDETQVQSELFDHFQFAGPFVIKFITAQLISNFPSEPFKCFTAVPDL